MRLKCARKLLEWNIYAALSAPAPNFVIYFFPVNHRPSRPGPAITRKMQCKGRPGGGPGIRGGDSRVLIGVFGASLFPRKTGKSTRGVMRGEGKMQETRFPGFGLVERKSGVWVEIAF